MLKVDQVHVIRHKVLVEGLGIRRVAREMGVSRNTVRKYLQQAEPVRQSGKARARPVLEVVVPRIAEILAEWASRTTPKQRVTAARVHRQLREDGYRVGRTSVQAVLRERRRQAAEVFVPLVHRPGDEAQVDFFDVTVDLAGERQRAWLFVMRLMYSGRDFAWLYDWADQVSFLDGHVRAFAHFGSVPHRLIYDNLTSAVRRLVLPERTLTARFQALASHYLFEPCFARPATGHDKGGVEARGKGIRLQHLTPIPAGESLEAVSGALLARLDADMHTGQRGGRTIHERFVEEQPQMLPLREPPFEPRKVVCAEVSRHALVRIDGATYSVPTAWYGRSVTAYVGATDVRIVGHDEAIVHRRQRFGTKVVRYRHYLPELARKPQALRQVAAELLGELGEPYGAFWRLLVDAHGPREAARVFARVLAAVVTHGEPAVAQAISAALAADRTDLLALARHVTQPTPVVTVPETLRDYHVEAAPLDAYNALVAEDPS